MTDTETLATIFGQRPESETQQAVEAPGRPLRPPAPASLADTGLSPTLLQELVLKIIRYADRATAGHISQICGLPAPLAKEIVEGLKQEHLCEVTTSSDYTMASDFKYSLTPAGQKRAEEALERCRYAGVAPVPLKQYESVMASQDFGSWRPSPEAVADALHALVLDDHTRDRLSRALRSGQCSMVFGPSGNGKSQLLTEFVKTLDGEILIPYSIYAYGQIIRLFDSATHEQTDPVEPKAKGNGNGSGSLLDPTQSHEAAADRRWVRIKRPGVIVGGELGPESLELGYDTTTRFYQAPAHLKAQGGVLVIDDFGRQKISAVDLLNRLIMPLERGRDHLLLRTGEGIEIPFHVTLLFSTNLNPDDLADSAYLRRIPYKVKMPPCGTEQFVEILRTTCDALAVSFDNEALTDVTSFVKAKAGDDLNGAMARDLVSIVVENSRQDGVAPALSVPAIELAYEQFSGLVDDAS